MNPRKAAIEYTDTAAIESLRTFAEQHGEIVFTHLCDRGARRRGVGGGASGRGS
jgi:hypothetical protein